MTNDGDLAHKLMHPRYEIEKSYLVLVAGQPEQGRHRQAAGKGVWLSEGKVAATSR